MRDISCKRRNLFGRYYLWESILQSPPSWALIANNTGLSGKSLENSFYGPPASRKWRGNDALMYWQIFLWETNTFNKCNGLVWLPINPPPHPPHLRLIFTNGHILAKTFSTDKKREKNNKLNVFQIVFLQKKISNETYKNVFFKVWNIYSPDKCKHYGFECWSEQSLYSLEHCSDGHKGKINNSYSISPKKSYALG